MRRLNQVTFIERWSADGKYGIRIPFELLESMQALCDRAVSLETGGILVGNYNENHDCALLSEITGPPVDSKRGSTMFFRGVKGLMGLLRSRWKEQRTYYLGEWHFHPGGRPIPSSVDHEQMKSIAKDLACRCPEPLLLIMGQKTGSKRDFAVFIYPDGNNAISMAIEKDGPDEVR